MIGHLARRVVGGIPFLAVNQTFRFIGTTIVDTIPSITQNNIKENTTGPTNSTMIPKSITKLIAETGVASRQEAERMVTAGRVTINGDLCRSPLYKMVLASSDVIMVDGVQLKRQYAIDRPARLWAIKKHPEEFMADSDVGKDRHLVVSRLLSMLPEKDIRDNPNGFKPVYRLEYNMEGLCFFTNSGEFARVLNSDTKTFGKQFRVRVHGLVNESKLDGLRRGLFVDGIKYQPMDVSVQTKAGTISWLNVTSYDNRNQAIKKSFENLFLKITRIICVGFGEFKMDELIPAGSASQCREVKLSPEMNALYLKMQNNHRGMVYKTKVKQDLQKGVKKAPKTVEYVTTF